MKRKVALSLTGSVFKPIDLLKDVEFRKQVQSAFKSTTREQWNQARVSKTQPPEVGKYKPKYNQLDNNLKAAAIHKEHSHTGKTRILDR